MRDLPEELVREVLLRLPVVDLHGARRLSKALCALIDKDPRWLPIIAPPACSGEVLSLAVHGPMLIKLYSRYRQWIFKWQNNYHAEEEEMLRSQTTALDGFFALAPWDRLAVDGASPGEAWTALPWLQRMVYELLPAAEVGVSDEALAAGQFIAGASAGAPRRSSRLKIPTPDERPSRWYQRRERDDEDAFRTFFSVPIDMSLAYNERRPLATRYVLQPTDVLGWRRVNAGYDYAPDARLPQLSPSALAALETAREVLSCYIPAESVHVAPTQFQEMHYEDIARFVRRDAQKTFLPNGDAVHQLSMNAFREAYLKGEYGLTFFAKNEFITFVVAPHLRPVDQIGRADKSLAWVFSSPVVEMDDPAYFTRNAHWAFEKKDENGSDCVPWVVSTHQLEAHLEHSEALRTRVLVRMLLYCTLGNGVGLELCCESDPCALNNCDSVGESAATSLLLCPACLRKLQFLGVLRDVPACLSALHRELSRPALREVSHRDLATLREWGYGAAGSSDEPFAV